MHDVTEDPATPFLLGLGHQAHSFCSSVLWHGKSGKSPLRWRQGHGKPGCRNRSSLWSMSRTADPKIKRPALRVCCNSTGSRNQGPRAPFNLLPRRGHASFKQPEIEVSGTSTMESTTTTQLDLRALLGMLPSWTGFPNQAKCKSILHGSMVPDLEDDGIGLCPARGCETHMVFTWVCSKELAFPAFVTFPKFKGQVPISH